MQVNYGGGSVRPYFGCCSSVGEQAFQEHTRGYPIGFKEYLRGVGNKNLPNGMKSVLEILSDNLWHGSVGCSGIGTVMACLDLELIEEMRLEPEKRANRTPVQFKITERGQASLKEGKLPHSARVLP